jgi:heat shock protein HslJ
MKTQSNLRLAAGLALAALMTAACSPAAASLADHEFLSVSVTDGGAARPLAAGTRIRLNFSGSNLGASAGCNAIGGTYRMDGGRLVFEGGSMTEMACDPERDKQDQWLITLLASKPTLRLVGNELTLESGSIVVKLLDRTVVEPDANLVGPTWTLTSIIQGDAVSSIPDGKGATLKFSADSRFELFAGCNRGGGSWKLVGGGIEVSDVVTTKMACDGPAATIESAVMEVLRAGSLSAEIRGNSLTLQADANGLQLTAG